MVSNLLSKTIGIFLCALSSIFAINARAGWTPMESGTTLELRGVWGSSATDVFAVGVGGIILHYDGNPEGIWSAMENESS